LRSQAVAAAPSKGISFNPHYQRHPRSIDPHIDLMIALIRASGFSWISMAVCRVWGDLFNRPVCGFVHQESNKEQGASGDAISCVSASSRAGYDSEGDIVFMKHSRNLVRLVILLTLISIGLFHMPGGGLQNKAFANKAPGAPPSAVAAAQISWWVSPPRVGVNSDGRLEVFATGNLGQVVLPGSGRRAGGPAWYLLAVNFPTVGPTLRGAPMEA
jgi:hypothetical protein